MSWREDLEAIEADPAGPVNHMVELLQILAQQNREMLDGPKIQEGT